MAVEIPVYINIEQAFQDAAKRVPAASAPLQKSLKGLYDDLKFYQEGMQTFEINSQYFKESARAFQLISEAIAVANTQLTAFTTNAGSIRQMNAYLAELNRQWEEMAGEKKFTADGQLTAEAKELKAKYQEVTAEINKSGKSLVQMEAEEQRILSLKNKGIQTRKYENAVLNTNIKSMRILQEQERILTARLQAAPVGSDKFIQLSAQLKQVQVDMAKASEQIKRGGAAYRDLGADAASATKGINTASAALSRQGGILSRLSTYLSGYMLLFAGFRFIRNVREVTAELELQKIALGSIIQDADKANDLFRQIKAAALKSPFEIKDLVTYTKQLAAYRIETENLFETTQRLADISAGLGVDMNRLILAYGQVRAASVLRGQELRQFTEAGIPLVDELAKKFQELGREGTTTADVFELISKRAVPFSMIKEIFEDMTNAGGIFYKMQEKQSETLKGQWMKLKDAVTIMYDEIGNTTVVHKAMTDLIKTALAITRNWQDMARWIAAGTTSLVAYATVSKATAIASSALVRAEAKRLIISKQQTVVMPKVLAAIVGETAAKNANRWATHQLTIAQYKLATANGVLEKTFWKVAVAIMKNPYAAAAAALTAIGFGIYAIVKNSREAAVTVDSLNDAMTRTQDAASKVAEANRLINIYKELSEKTDKTADEQAKLSRVTRELAQSFPSAVAGLNAEGEALDINIEKVQALAKAEAMLAQQRLKRQADEAKTQLSSLEAEAKRLTSNIIQVSQKGGLYAGKNLRGEAIIQEVSEETLEKWGNRLREITQKIYEYKEALKQLEDAEFIGPMPSETKKATAQLENWKQTIISIQEKGGIHLWDDTEIEKFDSILKFSKALKTKIEEITQSAKYNEAQWKRSTGEIKKSYKAALDADNAMLKIANAIKDALQIVFSGFSGRDTRLSQLKSDISELTNAYKKFEELRKYKSEDQALIDVKKLFPQLGDLTPTLDNIVKELENKLAKVKADLAKSPTSKTLLDMQRALETEISNLRFDELKRSLETKLKRLSDEIKRSEAARNFYKDIFNLTGDETLATSLSVEVYGDIGSDFGDRLQQQLNAVLSNISADADLSRAFQTQNFGYILDHLAQIPEKWHKEIKDLADAQQKFSADQIKTWLNELKKAKTYADQRIELARKTQERIAEINSAKGLTDDEKQDFSERYRRREQEEAAKLRYEAFKGSPLYVQMFGDLESASERMLRTMRKNITEIMGEWKNLSPTELKEMQRSLLEIDSQLAKKNPFRTLSESIEHYNKLIAQGRSRQGDIDRMVAADKEQKVADKALDQRTEELKNAEQMLKFAKEKYGVNSLEYGVAAHNVKLAKDALKTAKKRSETARTAANQTANEAAEWDAVAKNIDAATAELEQYLSVFKKAGDTVRDALELLVGDDAADFARQVMELFETLESSIKQIATAAAKAAGDDISGAFQAAASGVLLFVDAGIKAAKMIESANLKKWTDQMEEQDRAVRRLDRSYSKLEKAMAASFGSDYIYNYNEALEVLYAKQEAYLQKAEIQADKAARASGKANREAAAEQEKEMREEADKVGEDIKELREKMQEFYAGTSLTSAAEEFANAWLDAYRQFGNTADAIKDKMEDMINNLIVKSSLAKVAESVLEPFFTALENAAKTETLTAEIPNLVALLNSKTGELNESLNAMGQVFRSSGINLRSTVGNLSGISRDIATASEESILALAAGINTQNFYMSYMPTISADVRQIAEIMSGSTGQAVVQTAAPEGAVMPSIQEMLYQDMPVIKSHLANIERMLGRVIVNGTSTGWYVATKL